MAKCTNGRNGACMKDATQKVVAMSASAFPAGTDIAVCCKVGTMKVTETNTPNEGESQCDFKKMFSGKLGRALMPIVSIILFLWLVQSSMGPDTDISDVVQEIFNTVSSSASMTETEPDRNNFETSNTGTSQTNNSESVGDSIHAIKTNPSEFISVSDIPAYSGDAYVAVNDNVPYFTDEDYSTEPFEYYSDLDSLGRCGLTYAVVCQETMPTERRESISEVKPSGWKIRNTISWMVGGSTIDVTSSDFS